MKPVARLLRGGIRLYQRLPRFRPPVCRFEPTCSHYGLGAIETHGAGKGSWLAIRRVCRCHPWGGSGWDPVPEVSSIAPSAPLASSAASAPEELVSAPKKEVVSSNV
ncbi:MAG: putative membrane protein insertion efficiency factor [Candidatus Poriferisodalaceae bacterium]|jgi:putative membrane protein insertion efficiency factor